MDFFYSRFRVQHVQCVSCESKHDIEFHMCFNQGEQGGEGEQGPPGEPGSMVM